MAVAGLLHGSVQINQEPEDVDYESGDEPECHTCGGDGFLEANEAYCDWVNYGDELVTCTNCKGSGLRKDCTVF